MSEQTETTTTQRRWTDGLIIGESFEEYRRHSKTHLTSHQLATYRRSPKLYKMERDGLTVWKTKREYVVGEALHTLLLEGDEVFAARFHRGGPINKRTGEQMKTPTAKGWIDFEESIGKHCLTEDEWALIHNMAESTLANPSAAMLLRAEHRVTEAVIRTHQSGVAMQCRIDLVTLQLRAIDGLVPFICDIKTARSLDDIDRQIRQYGYAHQLAYYLRLWNGIQPDTEEVGPPPRCIIIAVEKAEPYRCQVIWLDPYLIHDRMVENAATIASLTASYASDTWDAGIPEWRIYSERDWERYETASLGGDEESEEEGDDE